NRSSAVNGCHQNELVFWKGCLPGGQGNLCKVCMGGTEEADNHNERYYGNMGALSGKSFGDVAFMEHHSLESNIERLARLVYFELLCGDGSRAPLTEWKTCNLGAIPSNIVMTHPVLTARIYDLLKSQVSRPDSGFHLFESQQYGESDLLFKDATRCLVHTSHMDYRTILGEEFYSQAESIFNCTHSSENKRKHYYIYTSYLFALIYNHWILKELDLK
uniref:Transferrin-like domain-containing protein n=1 Tax=Sinocyclocheilus rhinocerous TaxID=307959 RepID=A0A673MP18_9TELE